MNCVLAGALRHRNNIMVFLCRICLALPVVMLVYRCSPALAGPSVVDRINELDIPGFEWETQQTMRMSGVPIHVRNFSSRSAVMPAAHALAQHLDLFERALRLNSRMVLSGLRADWHWLAEVDVSASGSRGYVSAMRVGIEDDETGTNTEQPSFAWLPPQARRQFDYQNTVGGRKIIQQVYSVTLPMQTLTSYLRKQLRIGGWMPDPEFAVVGDGMTWGRSGARLMLLPKQGDGGSSLYVHYSE